MANKLLATVDIGSMSCIMLIAAFEDVPATPAPAENAEAETAPAAEPRKKLVPKLQKVKICKLGEDIYEHGRITEKKIQELVDVMTSFRMDLHALGADIQAVARNATWKRASSMW